LGRDIIVDNTAGDDRSTGEQPRATADRTGPVRTIAKALRLAGNSDTIVLANTDIPYRENISLVGSRHSGAARQPFTIRGNGAILDGSAPVPPEAWEPYRKAVFSFFSAADGLSAVVHRRSARRAGAGGVWRARAAGTQSRQWCLLGGRIYFCVEPAKLPADYRLSYARQQTGITLFHVDHVLIADLIVQGFHLDGVNLFNSARNVSVVGVTCRGNGRSGFVVGGASLVSIERSMIGDNGESQLLTLPYSETYVGDTHLLGNTARGWVDRGGPRIPWRPARGRGAQRASSRCRAGRAIAACLP